MSERIDIILQEVSPSESQPASPVGDDPSRAQGSVAEPGWFAPLKKAFGAALPWVVVEGRKLVKKALAPREAQAYAIKKGVELRKQEIETDRLVKLAEIERLRAKDAMDHKVKMTELQNDADDRLMDRKLQALDKITALITQASRDGVIEDVNIKNLTEQLLPQLTGAATEAAPKGKGAGKKRDD